jgi:hypothetical protein
MGPTSILQIYEYESAVDDIDRENQKTLGKNNPSATLTPQIQHGLTWEKTWASVVRSW